MGIVTDILRAQGAAQPYSLGLLIFTILSAAALPAFFLAGRWFKRDRDRLPA